MLESGSRNRVHYVEALLAKLIPGIKRRVADCSPCLELIVPILELYAGA